jgi:hypothetical protein
VEATVEVTMTTPLEGMLLWPKLRLNWWAPSPLWLVDDALRMLLQILLQLSTNALLYSNWPPYLKNPQALSQIGLPPVARPFSQNAPNSTNLWTFTLTARTSKSLLVILAELLAI